MNRISVAILEIMRHRTSLAVSFISEDAVCTILIGIIIDILLNTVQVQHILCRIYQTVIILTMADGTVDMTNYKKIDVEKHINNTIDDIVQFTFLTQLNESMGGSAFNPLEVLVEHKPEECYL